MEATETTEATEATEATEGKQISCGVYGRAISEAKYESFSILGLLHVSIQKKWYSFWWNSFLAGFFK